MSGVPWRGRVGIIGLGLMGGSLARELTSRGVRVHGHDANRATVEEATKIGVLEPLGESLAELSELDVLVVAVPVDRAGDAIAMALPKLRPDCVITDVGSTKRSIVEEAERLGIGERFVGSHPLTGGHRSGWGASHRDLYAWQRVFLCPTRQTSPAALARVSALWELVGALPEVIDAAEHDRRVAWTSHLPQVAATGLALALAGAGQPRSELGPGGRDTTRLAASSPEMWSAIGVDNADLLEEALAAFEKRIRQLRLAVAGRDAVALCSLFAEARDWADEQPPPR